MAKLVVFVHGLGADAETFWGSTLTALKTHPDMPDDFRIEPWGYETKNLPIPFWQTIPGISRRYETLEQLGQHLWSKLRVWKNDYTQIKLLGHSMGGLVIAAAVGYGLERYDPRDESLIQSLASVAFVGTPLGGANLADIAEPIFKKFGHNVHVSDLRKNSPSREKITNRFIQLALRDQENKIPFYLFRAANDEAVSEDELLASLKKDDYSYDTLDGGHSDCIKDLKWNGRDSDRYSNLMQIIYWIQTDITVKRIQEIRNIDNNLVDSLNKKFKGIGDISERIELPYEKKAEIGYLASEVDSINKISNKLKLIQERAQKLVQEVIPYLENRLEELNSEAYEFINIEEIEHIKEQMNMAKEFVDQIEAAKPVSNWIHQDLKPISENIADYALKLHPCESNLMSPKIRDDFHFSIQQFLELLSHCLAWGRSSALDFPDIPLVCDLKIYEAAFLKLKDMKPRSISIESYRYLGEYVDYLLERLSYCPKAN